jgi:ketosteroid isomerase-like protein
MSQDNVEIVKRALDAYNRRDVDAFVEFAAPDFEWFTSTVGAVEGGSFRGREGIETYFREIHDIWQEVRALAEEFRDLGERVLVLGRCARGMTSSSGVQVPCGG